MREQLLGYLLGALDQDEHQEVQELLQENPSLHAELQVLRRQLAPLADGRMHYLPPPGLHHRVLAALPSPSSPPRPRVARPQATALSGDYYLADQGGWTLSDLIVLAAVLVAAVTIFVPALQDSRDRAHRLACQRNLSAAGMGLMAAAEFDPEGRIPAPQVDDEGCFAAYPVAWAQESGFIDPEVRMVCPSTAAWRRATSRTPTLAEIRQASAPERAVMQANLSGTYAYPLGVAVNGNVVGARLAGRHWFGLMSDGPRWTGDHDLRTISHSGRGYNMLYEDGSVQFRLANREVAWSDDPYLNRRGERAPGVDEDDAVLGNVQMIGFAPQR